MDEGQLAMLEELRTPLEQIYPDEFSRYGELFYKYLPKRPFHVRRRYGDGFICAKGKYKKSGEAYERFCCPALIAKHLDYSRWKEVRVDRDHPPNYWIAMNAGRKSALKALDIDNKENLLGYYRDGRRDDSPIRPLPTLPLEHLQAVKRIYDAFPGHVWCISSATLGLHAWQKFPWPLTIDAIHAGDRPRLRQIGLGGTEIHPMFGRCFRRPFGEDYFTITDKGMLENWVQQLDYFEKVAEPPGFGRIYQALRSLLLKEWGGYRRSMEMTKLSSTTGKPHLTKYLLGNNLFDSRQLDEDLKATDAWADHDFPQNQSASEAVLTDLSPAHLPGKQHAVADRPRQDTYSPEKPTSGCEIDLSAVCDGQWVQNCEKWARDGLPCHDSIFIVVSHLARWFYFIEWWDMPEDLRLERIVEIMTDFVLAKHNGFVSRLDAGQERDVVKQIGRIVSCAVTKVDESGKLWFMLVRQKRQLGQYRRIIFLEPIVRKSRGGKAAEDSETPSSSLGLICCSDLREDNGRKQTPVEPQADHNPPSSPPEVNNGLSDLVDIDKATDRRTEAERWVFQPDDTPLPDELRKNIEAIYQDAGKRLYKPTTRKITRFINYVHKKNGEARLGVKALAKMGFPDHDARKHLEMLAEAGIIRKVKGYSPALAQGLRYRLTKRTMTMFGSSERKSRSA